MHSSHPTLASLTSRRTERVLIHRYSVTSRSWSKQTSEVAVDDTPFSEGAFRVAYRAWMLDESSQVQNLVCKFAKDTSTPRSLYFNDVEAQEYATMWAATFNQYLPHDRPRVGFVPCFVLELVDRPGRPLCGCEALIDGEFRKHNNNVGAVCLSATMTDDHREDVMIAQAFSHFTYEHSNQAILICDIQGVSGQYTDPQIHTISGKGFGNGNLGQTGIRAFLMRHTCNELCNYAKLSPIVAKELGEKNVRSKSRSTDTVDDVTPPTRLPPPAPHRATMSHLNFQSLQLNNTSSPLHSPHIIDDKPRSLMHVSSVTSLSTPVQSLNHTPSMAYLLPPKHLATSTTSTTLPASPPILPSSSSPILSSSSASSTAHTPATHTPPNELDDGIIFSSCDEALMAEIMNGTS